MSVKDELHELVEQLGDDGAAQALAYLRQLLNGEVVAEGTASARLAARMEPSVMAGREFFSQPAVDLETLAATQGVRPITNLDDLVGDFWPEDESVDDFVAAVRRWRREGGDG